MGLRGRSWLWKGLRKHGVWPLVSCGRVALDGPAGGELAGTSLDMVKAMAVTNQVPHLRWSQAPPLPWPRPGSADFPSGVNTLPWIFVEVADDSPVQDG